MRFYFWILLLVVLAGCAAERAPAAELPDTSPPTAVPPAPYPLAGARLPLPPGSYPLPHEPTVAPSLEASSMILARTPGPEGLAWGELWLAELGPGGEGFTEERVPLSCAAACQVERFSLGNRGVLAYSIIDGQGGSQLRVTLLQDSVDRPVLESSAVAPARWGHFAMSPDGTGLVVGLVRSDGQLVARDQYSLWYLPIGGTQQQLTEWSYISARFFWVGSEHIVTNEGDAISYLNVRSGIGKHLGVGRVVDLAADNRHVLVWLEPTDSDMGSAYDQPSAFGVMALDREPPELVHRFRMPARESVLAPDGSQVAQLIGGNLVLVTSDGQSRQLTDYTPGSKGTDVAPGMAEEVVGSLAWTQDGKGLLFVSGLPGQSATYKLQHLSLADSTITTVAEQLGHTFVIVR